MTDSPKFPARMAARIELWPIERVLPYAGNPRAHPEEQILRLCRSIQTYGFINPILLDQSSGVILGGHGRLEAARRLGFEAVPVVPVEHLSPAERRAYVIADNRLAELSTWDDERLRKELEALGAELPELPELGFDLGEIRDLLRPPKATPADADEPAPAKGPKERPVSRLGDVWTCGGQRIACGDSRTTAARELALRGELAQCLLTDPPYAIYGSSTGVGSAVADDRMVRDFFERVLRSAAESLRIAGHAYVFCDWRSVSGWTESARDSGLGIANLLVWDKGDFGLGANYRNNHELVLFLHRTEERGSHWDRTAKGSRAVHEPNVLRFPRTGQSGFEREQEPGERYHNAAKPVDLLRRLVSNSTEPGELVLDLFAGSGSTLVACELLQRRGAGIEIRPGNVDDVVHRVQRASKLEARLEGDGRTFEEIRSARVEKAERRKGSR